MRALFHTFSSRRRYERAQRLARAAARPLTRSTEGTSGARTIRRAPGPLAAWTSSRDLPAPAPESFREWWRRTRGPSTRAGTDSALTAHIAAKEETVSPIRMHDVQKGDTIAGGAGREGAGSGRDVRDARADILHRIRQALGEAAPPDIPRNYRTEDTRERDEIVTVFAERAAEYRATVHRVREGEIAEAVARIAAEAGARRIGIPTDLPAQWRPAPGAAAETGQMVPEPQAAGAAGPGEETRAGAAGEVAGSAGGARAEIELVEDSTLSVQQLDELDGALTGCAVAIAETGTFVLDAGTGQGRRALTLVPDLHICVVREDQVVGLVPEAVGRLERSVRDGRPLTFVSGPSATSDIELDRVEGVHGPRILHVVLAAR
jgi:L-lactate utilization protein LutC